MAYIFMDARRQYAYDILIIIPFKKLVSQLFYVSHMNECCIFAIARRSLLELTTSALEAVT